MRHLVTGAQMKEIDAHAIREIGIPSLVLMERAALSCCDCAEKTFPECFRRERKQPLLILAGTGNNGADGVAMARIWTLRGYETAIVTVGDPSRYTPEMQEQLDIADRLGIPVTAWNDFEGGEFILAVDALFGVGLSRNVEGDFADAVSYLNARNSGTVVAVDLPSGVDSRIGAILGSAVRADLTVTFGLEKTGMVFYPGHGLCGRIEIADIGFPEYNGYSGDRFFAYDAEDLHRIPPRKADSHKGTYGKVLIAAGSEGMCGAAYFAALAAYRTGAGLVRLFTVRANVPVLQTLLPEAIITAYDPEEAMEEPENFRKMAEEACEWASVIVLGPGLGTGRHVEKLLQHILLSAYVPIILDADGLNAVAEYPHLAGYFTENVIITPHIGEMTRLTDLDAAEIKRDPVKCAKEYSEEHGVICVLKDSVTVVARHDGNVFLGDSGSGAMAKGGSGDVLAGTIAGLAALDLELDDAACLGVYIHGKAGTLAGIEKGEHSVLATEIADRLMRSFTAS